MAVFPESIDRIDPDDPGAALSTIESYIRYMQERIEFSIANVARSVNSAGASSAETFLLLKDLQNIVSAVSSTVEGISREMTNVKQDVGNAIAAADSAKNYEKNINKPKINGTELVGSLTNEDIHIRELTNVEIQEILNK